MKDLAANSKDNSAQQHHRPDIGQPSKAVNGLPNNTDGTGDYEHDSGSDFIDHNASDERHDDIGEGIEGVE
jgi:hypothetical protein